MIYNCCVAQHKELQADSLLFDRLQFVYPRFNPKNDTLILKDLLFKYYSLSKFLGNEFADSVGIKENPTFKKELEYLLELVSERYLAERVKEHLVKMPVEVSEDEIKQYYTENLGRFTNPGTADFFIVYAKNNTLETRNAIEAVLMKKAELDTIDINTLEKFEDGDYALTANIQYPIQPGINFYDVLISAEIGVVSGPTQWGDRFVYILPIILMKPSIKSLAEVEALCRSEVVALKKAKIWEKVEQRAVQLYPITLPK